MPINYDDFDARCVDCKHLKICLAQDWWEYLGDFNYWRHCAGFVLNPIPFRDRREKVRFVYR
jgi:hypothetical protein